MAKPVYNSGLAHIRGAIDGWVYKKYHDARGVVLSRRPDMSEIKPTPKQKAQRARMAAAVAHYRRIKDDAAALKPYVLLARRRKTNVAALVIGARLRELGAKAGP